MTKGKILIIDDDASICGVIVKLLRLHNYEATGLTKDLTDIGKIVAYTAAEKPDLILLDYHLGVAFGLDVLETLKDTPAISEIPVVITSGIDHRKKVTAAGARGFLQKPFDWTELVSILDTLLHNEPSQSDGGGNGANSDI